MNLFTNLSWNQINAVCPAGDCDNGSGNLLNTFNLDGWTWASVNNIGELFNMTTPHPGGIVSHTEAGFTWGPAFFTTVGFNPTASDASNDLVWGWSSSSVAGDVTRAYDPFVSDFAASNTVDRVTTQEYDPKNTTDGRIGGWFYRSNTVPEPTTPALMGLGIACIGYRRYRSRIKVHFSEIAYCSRQ